MKIISVDFQADFAEPGGACYLSRPCVPFLKTVFFPYVDRQGLEIAEIISDYRLPRPRADGESCIPGTAGYKSLVPLHLKNMFLWIKCMNSPAWVRKNGGVAGEKPGLPFPDPSGLDAWFRETIGSPAAGSIVTLIGLTLDCCVLCTAQELAFRGYRVRYLVEGVDCYSGSREEKQRLFESAAGNWGQPLAWDEFQQLTNSSPPRP